jgi:hypothetical protein
MVLLLPKHICVQFSIGEPFIKISLEKY